MPAADRVKLISRVLQAGVDAPALVVRAAIEQMGRATVRRAENIKRQAGLDADVEHLVEKVINAHVQLARTEGAAAAIALTAVEVTTVVGTAGQLTPPAAIAGLAGDLIGLAWIQIRMVLLIASLYGHDPVDPDRAKELLTLMGVYGPPQVNRSVKAAGEGAQRVSRRLLLRHLRGDTLNSVKALFRMVGINFNRSGVVKALPVVNVPISTFVNGSATRALGRKARSYYRTLPADNR